MHHFATLLAWFAGWALYGIVALQATPEPTLAISAVAAIAFGCWLCD